MFKVGLVAEGYDGKKFGAGEPDVQTAEQIAQNLRVVRHCSRDKAVNR